MPIGKSIVAKVPGVVVWAALSCGCAAIPSPDTASGPDASLQVAYVPAGGLVRYTEEREACANRNPYRNAYFGDLHVHTSYSYDARPLGVTTVPSDAYRYARGEEILLPPHEEGGEPVPVRKVGPALDFAAVTDHAEFFGEHASVRGRQQRGLRQPKLRGHPQRRPHRDPGPGARPVERRPDAQRGHLRRRRRPLR